MGRRGGGRSFGGRSGGGRSRPSHTHTPRVTRAGYRPYRHIIRGRNSVPSGGGSAGIIWILLAFLLAGVFSFFTISGNMIPDVASTVDRTPLVGQVNETGWYEDNLDWVIYPQVLTDGLVHFYEKTGVQPYLLLTAYDPSYWQGDEIDVQAVESYLNDYYESHFTDEAHIIFAYFASADDSITEMEGHFYYLCGYAADKIMDEEALDIFWTYLEHYYRNTSDNLEQMISHTFSHTADVIMGSAASTGEWQLKEYSGLLLLIPVVILVGLCCLILLAHAIGKREQKSIAEIAEVTETKETVASTNEDDNQ